MAEAVDAYLEVRKGANITEGTRDDKWFASLVLEWLRGRVVSKLTVAQCDHFLELCAGGLNGRRPIGRDRIKRLRRFLIAVLHNEMRANGLTKNVAELSVSTRKQQGET